MKPDTVATRGGGRAARDEDAVRAAAATAEAEGLARFLRGMTLGALVGAAIAGSAVWQRARNRTERPSVPIARAHRPTVGADRPTADEAGS